MSSLHFVPYFVVINNTSVICHKTDQFYAMNSVQTVYRLDKDISQCSPECLPRIA